MSNTHPYDALTPDVVLDAVEAAGFEVNGRQFALNSYENRVYQVGVEDRAPVVVKFYRPERWSLAQIQEEHQFCADLLDAEIPVVAPLPLADNSTLGEHAGFRFAVFDCRGGQAPDVSQADTLYRIGQWLGQMHAVGERQPFKVRPRVAPLEDLLTAREALLSGDWIPTDLRTSWNALVEDLIRGIEERLRHAPPLDQVRLHGDCHAGNILMRDEQILFVDFDDARQGPAIQDLWLLLSGDTLEQRDQLAELVEGYEQFRDFERRATLLIEPLRTSRLICHSAWLARRWDDPAFPRHFPWFVQPRYWGDQILSLREQLSALREPPLSLPGA